MKTEVLYLKRMLHLYMEALNNTETMIDTVCDDLKAMQKGTRDVDIRTIIEELEQQQSARQACDTWGTLVINNIIDGK